SLIYTPKYKPEYSEEHVGVMLSDLHIGANYSKKSTGGLGYFDIDTYHHRIKVMKKAVMEITERHRHMYNIRHLHVFCLGDVVAGMNDAGDWSSVYIGMGIVDQVFEAVASLRDMLSQWSTGYEKISFYGVY